MRSYPLYLIGALTGNPLFFGFFATKAEATAAGAAYGETETVCGYFVGSPVLVINF